jgi:hypothetical protein
MLAHNIHSTQLLCCFWSLSHAFNLTYSVVFAVMVHFSGGLVIVTVNPLALLYSLIDQEFTFSNRDRTRPYETFIITIKQFQIFDACIFNKKICIENAKHHGEFLPCLSKNSLVWASGSENASVFLMFKCHTATHL